MKPTITTEPNPYGFGRDWTLHAFGRSFFLGQDVKFCHRVLGMTGTEVVIAIGSDNLSDPKARKSLARLVLDRLDLDEEKISKLEPWALCP